MRNDAPASAATSATSSFSRPGDDNEPQSSSGAESSTDIPEDVALAILLHAVSSRIDPTGELYMKLCSSFKLSSATTLQVEATRCCISPLHSPLHSPCSASANSGSSSPLERRDSDGSASGAGLERRDSSGSTGGLSWLENCERQEKQRRVPWGTRTAAGGAEATAEEEEEGGDGKGIARCKVASPTVSSSSSSSSNSSRLKWGVEAGGSVQEQPPPRTSPNLSAGVTVSELLAHLEMLGLSDLMRSIRARVVASIPTALATQVPLPLPL